MRHAILPALFVAVLLLQSAAGQEKEPEKTERFGIGVSENYSQKTPQETVVSVVRALDRKRIDYLCAQLADPKFVDARVMQYGQLFPAAKPEARPFLAFDRLVKEIQGHYQDDPQLQRELRAFAREGTFEENGDGAVGSAKSVPARKVYLKKVGERWFLENRQ